MNSKDVMEKQNFNEMRNKLFILVLLFMWVGAVTYQKLSYYWAMESTNHKDKEYRTDFTLTKSKPRIIFLGGSTTHGTGNKISGTYPYFLQQLMPTFEILNLGIAGAKTRDHILGYYYLPWKKGIYDTQEEDRFEFGYKDMDADLIVIAPCWNDFAQSYINSTFRYDKVFWWNYEQIRTWSFKYLHHNPIGFFVERLICRTISSFIKPPKYVESDVIELKNKYYDTLTLLAKVYEKEKIMFLILPSSEPSSCLSVNTSLWGKSMMMHICQGVQVATQIERETILKVGMENGIEVIDLSQMPRDKSMFSDTIHLTAKGNKEVAKQIWERLKND